MRGITLPNIKVSYIATLIKSDISRWRHLDQWNTTEKREENSYIYTQLIFDTSAKAIQWKNDVCLPFQQMVLEQLDIHILRQKYEPQFKFHIFYKMKSNWITDLEL